LDPREAMGMHVGHVPGPVTAGLVAHHGLTGGRFDLAAGPGEQFALDGRLAHRSGARLSIPALARVMGEPAAVEAHGPASVGLDVAAALDALNNLATLRTVALELVSDTLGHGTSY